MALKSKYFVKHETLLRDARPWTVRFVSKAKEPDTAGLIFIVVVVMMNFDIYTTMSADFVFIFGIFYFWWVTRKKTILPFRLPKSAKKKDPNYKRPDGSIGMADGILYLGNDTSSGEEIWFTNSDARTHCLYLGTTGSGKTFGLKSYACNALCWSSGFIFIDGKADTDLWSTLSAMARRFGRDDDLLIMNYLTGNASGRVASNTLNPFSSGSASYLTNMLVSLMPDSEGDNAMWKERAVALVSALMPCLVWKRDHQNIPLSIGVIRQYLTFKAVIQLARDKGLPDHMRTPVQAYLNELPGYVDNVFDDNGDEKPGADSDTSVPRQQHGYLSMQFTRSMQSLGDDYGFIFDTQAADVDMLDVVLNRRILVVLIPALEKSGDETANLGKIIASTLKGMMGATLGSTVEGDTATAIENKPTNSATPFISIFDEVGYYTSQGMAVMAAQARSLGFSLVFAGQDLPALEKRVKEEARSITANCNIKLFGKLEDPTSTKEFFEKTVGQAIVTEVSGFARRQGSATNYGDSENASIQVRSRASYDGLRGFTEGKAVCAFGSAVNEIQVYNSDIGHARAMRVHRFLPVVPPNEDALKGLRTVDAVLKRLRNPKWRADAAETPASIDINALAAGFAEGRKAATSLINSAVCGVAAVAEAHGTISPKDALNVDAPPAASPPKAAKTINAEAEKVAAAEIANATKTGPLSWMEVIGGNTDVTLPATSGGGSMMTTSAPASAPISWDAVVAENDDGSASIPAASGMTAAEEAAAAQVPNAMSWLDVIGMGPAMAAPAPVTTSVQPVQAPAMPTIENMPFSEPQDFLLPPQPSPLEQPAQRAAAKEIPSNAMSWLDVIGALDEAEKEKK